MVRCVTRRTAPENARPVGRAARNRLCGRQRRPDECRLDILPCVCRIAAAARLSNGCRGDLPSTRSCAHPSYYAFYRWLRDTWRANAIVHIGKHGTLEWLPGKGVGLSENCFPDAL